jgi:hypothetical protein
MRSASAKARLAQIAMVDARLCGSARKAVMGRIG